MGKSLLLVLSAMLLAACTVPAYTPPATGADGQEDIPSPDASTLPDLGAAPELQNEVFLNTEEQLRLSDLRGQVVLLDMWTFG